MIEMLVPSRGGRWGSIGTPEMRSRGKSVSCNDIGMGQEREREREGGAKWWVFGYEDGEYRRWLTNDSYVL